MTERPELHLKQQKKLRGIFIFFGLLSLVFVAIIISAGILAWVGPLIIGAAIIITISVMLTTYLSYINLQHLSPKNHTKFLSKEISDIKTKATEKYKNYSKEDLKYWLDNDLTNFLANSLSQIADQENLVFEIITIFLENGLNPDSQIKLLIKGDRGTSEKHLLQWAHMAKNIPLMKLLLEKGANPNRYLAPSGVFFMSHLTYECDKKNPNIEIIKLLSNDVRTALKANHFIGSSLTTACINPSIKGTPNQYEIIKILLKSDPTQLLIIDFTDNMTPLEMAYNQLRNDVFEYMLITAVNNQIEIDTELLEKLKNNKNVSKEKKEVLAKYENKNCLIDNTSSLKNHVKHELDISTEILLLFLIEKRNTKNNLSLKTPKPILFKISGFLFFNRPENNNSKSVDPNKFEPTNK